MSNDIGKKTAKGLYWNLSIKVPYEVLHFALSIIVARILDPRDFGLASIATMAVFYSNTFTNFGFNQALVQRKDITPGHINAIFTFDLLLSGVLTALFWILAVPIATFFNAPECKDMIRVMSLLFILSTFHDLPYTLLRRNIDFKVISLVDAGREITMALLTLTLAFCGLKYWSIIFGRLIAVFLTSLYLLYKVDWSPRISFHVAPLKELFNFGIWTVISSQVYFFSTRIDRILIGKFLNVSILGLYDKAKGFAQMPTDSLAQNINNVLFSSFSRAQESAEEVKNLFNKGLVIITALIFPMYFGLIAVAPHFVVALLGEKWSAMTVALQILSISGLFATLNGLFATLVIATGNYRSYTRRLIVMTAFLLLVNVFIAKYGMEVVAVSVAAYSCILSWLSWHLVCDKYTISGKEIIARILPAVCGSSVMFIVVRSVSIFFLADTTMSNLIMLIGLGAVTYIVAMALIPAPHLKEIREKIFQDASTIWLKLAAKFRA